MNKKKQAKKISKFPNIYRFIPDLKTLTWVFIFSAALVLIVLFSLDLFFNLKNLNAIKNQRQRLLSELNYWQQVVKKEKDYRDGYFMLAVLQYQLKDFQKAEEYLKKVLAIDPNFAPGQDLQKALNGEM